MNKILNKIKEIYNNFIYEKQKNNPNKNQLKEYIKQINNIFYKLYSADLRNNIIIFVKNNEFDNEGTLNYTTGLNKQNKKDKIFFELKRCAIQLQDKQEYKVNDYPLFSTYQKENTNEYLVYINPEIIKLVKNN